MSYCKYIAPTTTRCRIANILHQLQRGVGEEEIHIFVVSEHPIVMKVNYYSLHKKLDGIYLTYIAMNEEANNLEFYYTLKEKCYNLKTKCVVNYLV